MKISVPHDGINPIVRISVSHAGVELTSYVMGDDVREMEIDEPKDFNECEVIVTYCDCWGVRNPAMTRMVLKDADPPKDPPKSEPKKPSAEK